MRFDGLLTSKRAMTGMPESLIVITGIAISLYVVHS